MLVAPRRIDAFRLNRCSNFGRYRFRGLGAFPGEGIRQGGHERNPSLVGRP